LIQYNITTKTLKKRIANINITRLKSAASGWSNAVQMGQQGSWTMWTTPERSLSWADIW